MRIIYLLVGCVLLAGCTYDDSRMAEAAMAQRIKVQVQMINAIELRIGDQDLSIEALELRVNAKLKDYKERADTQDAKILGQISHINTQDQRIKAQETRIRDLESRIKALEVKPKAGPEVNSKDVADLKDYIILMDQRLISAERSCKANDAGIKAMLDGATIYMGKINSPVNPQKGDKVKAQRILDKRMAQ